MRAAACSEQFGTFSLSSTNADHSIPHATVDASSTLRLQTQAQSYLIDGVAMNVSPCGNDGNDGFDLRLPMTNAFYEELLIVFPECGLCYGGLPAPMTDADSTRILFAFVVLWRRRRFCYVLCWRRTRAHRVQTRRAMTRPARTFDDSTNADTFSIKELWSSIHDDEPLINCR